MPSLDEREFYEKAHQECILLGKRRAARVWEEAHVVVMLISRKCGYAQRVGITNMSEEFWNLANKTWELIALGSLIVTITFYLPRFIPAGYVELRIYPERHVKYN